MDEKMIRLVVRLRVKADQLTRDSHSETWANDAATARALEIVADEIEEVFGQKIFGMSVKVNPTLKDDEFRIGYE